MIKKFDTFLKSDILDNEINHYERELEDRKNKRKNLFVDNYFFDDIKKDILNDINNNNYYISTGKKTTSINGITDDKIHIEYSSSKIGNVKIFKPDDDSNIGYFEINGKLHGTSSDDIRLFYHRLSQLIK